MHRKVQLIISGGILGIVAMRMLIGQLLRVVQRYPALVDGAFIIIAWVGFKLLLEFAHEEHWIAFQIPKWFSLGLIVVIFAIAYVYARKVGPVDVPGDEEASDLLDEAGQEHGDA